MDYFKAATLGTIDKKHAKIVLGADFHMFDASLEKLGYIPSEVRKLYGYTYFFDPVLKESIFQRCLDVLHPENNEIVYNICVKRDVYEVPDGFTDYGTDEEYTYTLFYFSRNLEKIYQAEFNHRLVTYDMGRSYDVDDLTFLQKTETTFLDVFRILGLTFFRRLAEDIEPSEILKNFT